MNVKDMGLEMDEWADLIDEAKKRNALGDMSTIAYRMLGVIITLRHNAVLTPAAPDSEGGATCKDGEYMRHCQHCRLQY